MDDDDYELAREIKRLLGLDYEDFREEVNEDVRPHTSERYRRAALRSPELVDRWFAALSQMSKSVDGQLAARTEDYEANKAVFKRQLSTARTAADRAKATSEWASQKESAHRSRAGTLRFKTGVDEALIEARYLRDTVRDSMYDTVVAEERNRYAARSTALFDAIVAHRQAMDDEDIEPGDHDERLWEAVER